MAGYNLSNLADSEDDGIFVVRILHHSMDPASKVTE